MCTKRLLDQLEDTSGKFDLFWQHHISKLAQCSQLRKFEEDFKQVKEILKRTVKYKEIVFHQPLFFPQLQVITETHLKRSSEIKFCFDDVYLVQEANDLLNTYEAETKVPKIMENIKLLIKTNLINQFNNLKIKK